MERVELERVISGIQLPIYYPRQLVMRYIGGDGAKCIEWFDPVESLAVKNGLLVIDSGHHEYTEFVCGVISLEVVTQP